jgi:hypothetical protein
MLGLLGVCTTFTLAAGCVDDQIGRPCNSLGKSPMSGVSFVSPAPDCPTRLCMVTPPPPPASMGSTAPARGTTETLSMCTNSCVTDSDCETSGEFTEKTRCAKYVCAVPSVVPGEENFCCKKLCVCQDDLIVGFNRDDPRGVIPKLPRDADGVAIPSACNKANKCQLNK